MVKNKIRNKPFITKDPRTEEIGSEKMNEIGSEKN